MLTKNLQPQRLLWKKIKRTIEWAFLYSLDSLVLATANPKKESHSTAIVHIELLGDYVLWSPYGRTLAQHIQAQGKHTTIIINTAALPLAQQHFPNCTIVGIDRARFMRHLPTRIRLLRKLRKLGAQVSYHDSHPRDYIVEDAAIRALGAPAWGFDATFPDRPWLDRWVNRRLYSKLLPPMDGSHQALRHLAFLRAAGATDDYLHKQITFAARLDTPKEKSYFVIAPGASRIEKCWPTPYFTQTAQRILEQCPDWTCIILGGPNELELGEKIAATLGTRADNLIGKTNLIEFVNFIANANLVLGNDSAACHIAAACGVKSFPIVGGGHIGSFFPYDPNEARVTCLPVAIFEEMNCFGCNWICSKKITANEPFPCISKISPDRVWNEVKNTLENKLRHPKPHPTTQETLERSPATITKGAH